MNESCRNNPQNNKEITKMIDRAKQIKRKYQQILKTMNQREDGLRYLSREDLQNEISQYCKTGRLSRQNDKFKKLFEEDCKVYEQMKGNYLFPFVKNRSSQQFMTAKIANFLSAYNDQREAQQKIHAFTQFYKDDVNQLRMKRKHMKNKNTRIIPTFILIKNYSMSALLSYETTLQFEQELNIVKDLLKSQLENKQSTQSLLSKYTDYLQQYLKFNKIKKQWIYNQDKSSIERQIGEYLAQRSSKSLCCFSQSAIFQQWNQFYKELGQKNTPQSNREQNNRLKNQCRVILLQGLKRIHLGSIYHQQILGFNSAGKIIIRSNPICKLSKKQFKNGPMKSFLYLLIVHQLTHYLLLYTVQCQLSETDQSFENNLQKITFGQAFVNQIRRNYNKIQRKYNYLPCSDEQISQDQSGYLNKNLSEIKRFFSLKDKIIAPFRDMINKIKQYYYQICKGKHKDNNKLSLFEESIKQIIIKAEDMIATQISIYRVYQQWEAQLMNFTLIKNKEQIEVSPVKIKYSKDTKLALQDVRRFNAILSIEQKIQKVAEFFRYYQLNATMNQLPSFFRTFKKDKCQSGEIFQSILFPNLRRQIFRKDFQFMKLIEKDQMRLEIGKQPEQNQERLYVVKVRKCLTTDDVGIRIDQKQCKGGSKFYEEEIYKRKSPISLVTLQKEYGQSSKIRKTSC